MDGQEYAYSAQQAKCGEGYVEITIGDVALRRYRERAVVAALDRRGP
jgi:hypothetical protein